MTASLIINPERWIGTSREKKPTGAPIGSKFYAHNTRKPFSTHDGKNYRIESHGAPTIQMRDWWLLEGSIDSDVKRVSGTHIRASNGLYTNPDTGLITTVGNNIPRFERQDGLLALLDEPAGTDLIHFSHELGNVASGGWWNDRRLTSVTADGDTGPDGTAAADGLVADVNNASHQLESAFIAGAGANDKYALTVFAKPGNNDWVYVEILFFDVGDVFLGDNGGYYFNISTGALGTKIEVGNVTVHDYKIESVANGFYRLGVIVSNTDVNTSKIKGYLYSNENDNNLTFIGDTTTVNTWFWEANLMKQAFFSSPVPTSGATATRATESGYPRYTLPTGLFDSQGTLLIWLYHGMAFGDYSAGDYGIVSLNGNAKSALYLDENGNICTFDGTNETTHNVNWPINTWRKYALTWNQATNIVQVGVDTGGGVALTGGVFDGVYDVAGGILSLNQGLAASRHLRDFRLYPRALTKPEIDIAGGNP